MKTAAKAKRLAIALGWQSPFFAIPAAKVRFVEDAAGAETKTMGVTACGTIYLHPPFCKKLSDSQFKWVIAHELMHLLMRHAGRRGHRTAMVQTPGQKEPFALWNIAGDMAINHALVTAGLKSYPKGAIFPEAGWETWSAERIYDQLLQDIPPSLKKSGGAGAGDGDPAPGAGCGVKPAKGPEDGTGAAKSDAALDQEWAEVAAAAASMERSQGSGAGNALADVCNPPPAKVNWGAVIRRGMASALAAHGRDSQTWTRRGRRSRAVGPQFPGWQATAARAAVVIDTSGSVSNEELNQFVAETLSIAKTSGVAIYLVTHDHEVQWEGWLSPRCKPAAVQQSLKGRGGTCARGAYKKVAEAGRFDVMIHLTDGELSWPGWPPKVRQKVVALVGYEPFRVPEGARVIEIGI